MYVCEHADADMLCALDGILKTRCAEHGPITPRLTQLCWPPNNVSDDRQKAQNVSIFLAETLVHLEVFVRQDAAMFEDIKHIAPRLRRLAVLMSGSTKFDEDPGNAVSATFFSARSLQTLSWDSELPRGWLTHLSSLRSLRRLHLRLPVPGSWDAQNIGALTPREAFAALQDLVLASESAEDAIKFLNYSRSTPLISLTLTCKMNPFSAPHALTMLSKIRRYHGRTLTYLRVDLRRYSWGLGFPPNPSQYTPPFLYVPMPSLTGNLNVGGSTSCAAGSADFALRTVQLNIGYITETQLTSFLAATLHELLIIQTDQVSLTLATLLVIADHCPHIRRLTITLRADPHSFRDHHAHQVLAHLAYLNVLYSSIEDAHDAALFLSGVCPLLTSIEWSERSRAEAKWREVNDILMGGIQP